MINSITDIMLYNTKIELFNEIKKIMLQITVFCCEWKKPTFCLENFYKLLKQVTEIRLDKWNWLYKN